MHNIKLLFIVILSIFFWQCEISVDEFQPSASDLDLSSYVALGDSYSAGYTNGALGRHSQLLSLPAILARQFELAGGGEFKQPLLPEGKSVGTTIIDAEGNLNGYFKLNVVNNSLKPTPTLGDKSVLFDLIGDSGPYNNMAVPGAKSYHLLSDAFGNPFGGNPFFTRFATEPGSVSVMHDAGEINHTFFSLWIGGNDILGFALAGGSSDLITPVENFENSMSLIVSQLINSGKKGVIANIPDINALPYFNVVPYNALPLTQEQADQLNAAYAEYNIAANSVGRPAIVFVEGQNALIIEDPKMDDMPYGAKFRQIKEGEKILLNTPTDKIATEGLGSQIPIPSKYVLDSEDLQKIDDAVIAYNAIIEKIAIENNLAFVDIYSIMNKLKIGLTIDGNTYTNTFVTGGIFSLDGIHATYRGYAIIANEFIKSINTKYNSVIPLVNINDYETVVFP